MINMHQYWSNTAKISKVEYYPWPGVPEVELFDPKVLHLFVGHLHDIVQGHTFLQEEAEELLKTMPLKELLQLHPFVVGESQVWL